MRFTVFEADCPWTYQVWADKKQPRNVSTKYNLMSNQDIIDLGNLIQPLANPDSTLFLWCTWPLMPIALQVGEAWGFEFKTCAFDWVKSTKSGERFHFGMGHWTRANSEPCLLFTRGAPQRHDKGIAQIISDHAPLDFYHEALVIPVMSHSRKPEQVYERIERLMGDVPRLRLFARDERPGWTSLGSAINGRDIREELLSLALL